MSMSHNFKYFFILSPTSMTSIYLVSIHIYFVKPVFDHLMHHSCKFTCCQIDFSSHSNFALDFFPLLQIASDYTNVIKWVQHAYCPLQAFKFIAIDIFNFSSNIVSFYILHIFQQHNFETNILLCECVHRSHILNFLLFDRFPPLTWPLCCLLVGS